jgi:hypothetical protein
MSSHCEAPEISKDPVADSTDVYAFVSPDKPDAVTLICNYIPLQGPAGGPNFYEFGDDVLYEIHIDNDGDAKPDITYQFRFTTSVRNPRSFLYNTGPIDTLDDADWNRRQTYSVTKLVKGRSPKVLASRVPSPPCNVGTRSTPKYVDLANMAIRTLPTGEKVFAGQRAEGFYVDLGSIFDLAALRPFQNLHLLPLPAAKGVNATAQLNVHTIALQVPITDLTEDGRMPTDPADSRATIGVYTSASRQKILVRDDDTDKGVGPSSRSRDWATRCSTRSSCRWAARTSGTYRVRPTTRTSSGSFSVQSSQPCCRCCIRASFRIWRRSTPTGRTWWPSCSPGSRRDSSRASRTSPGRSRLTCYGST